MFAIVDRIGFAEISVNMSDLLTNYSVVMTSNHSSHQATGVPEALPSCRHSGLTRPRRGRSTPSLICV